jgi:thioredoxin reductase
MKRTEFLIIGAGPYGIAAAGYAKSRGIDVTVVGKPLETWKTRMPRGMLLRSGADWHLDAHEEATFEAYARQRGLGVEHLLPMRVDTFLDYATWFMGRYNVAPQGAQVTHLRRSHRAYIATLDDGSQVEAEQVLLALGFGAFKYVPRALVDRLPAGSFTHTCDAVDFEYFRHKRVLIIGGRQSAYEWAALMNENGAEEIHVAHRHRMPRFAKSDWSWVQPMVRRTLDRHGWWRELSDEARERIADDFWAAARSTLEPWLDGRVHQPNVHIHPETAVAGAYENRGSTMGVLLDDGSSLEVHHVVLATGYRANMANVSFLDRSTILAALQTCDGHPVLGTEFQTNLPGLYATGLAAARDFGPFFGFTVACPVAARVIGDRVAGQRRARRALGRYAIRNVSLWWLSAT